MKKLLLLILPIIITVGVFAQNTNTWVDYNKTYYKIKVAETGMYTLSYETLTTAGFPIKSITGNELLLINEGKEIPIFVSNENKWTESDYLEFFGKKLDGRFDTQLYEKPEHQIHSRFSMFADTAVYYLTTGIAEQRITYFESNFENIPAKEEYFMHEVEYAEANSFNSGKPDGNHFHIHHPNYPLNLIDVYFGKYGKGESFLGRTITSNLPNYNNTKISLKTPCIYSNGLSATIKIKTVGLSFSELPSFGHHLKVKLNDELIVDNNFEEYSIQSHNLELFSLKKLNAQNNSIEFSTTTDTAYVDRIGIVNILIKYPRSFNFNNVNTFQFHIEGSGTSQYLEFENLQATENYFLFDLNNLTKTSLVYLKDKAIHAVHLSAIENEKRHLYLYKADKAISVEQLQMFNFTNYTAVNNQGDYIIISHPKLLKQGDAIEQYAAYRSSSKGGNYKPVIVNIEELYDQYSYGIAKHPLAIKNFLNDALENWNTKPRHCFLIGKGIESYRTLGVDNWNQNLIPTFGHKSSDQIFGSENFSPLSRLAIGRLNVTQVQEVTNYLNKVKAVELPYNLAFCSYVKEQQWRHQILHISGKVYDYFDYNPFSRRLLEQANLTADGAATAYSKFLVIDDNVESICKINGRSWQEQTIDCLKNILNDGIKIISFLGGSNKESWDLEIGSPLAYDFNNHYPIIIGQDEFAGNIYKANYTEDQSVLPIEWLNSANKGATAYIGFNYMSDVYTGADLIDDLYLQMFAENPHLTLGEQLNQAIHIHFNKTEFANKYAANAISYSGDPALKYYSNNQPEIILNEENINVDIDKLNDTLYELNIQFQIFYLNIPEIEEVPYRIIKSNGSKQEVVHSGFAKPNKTIYYKSEFEVQLNEMHNFTIEVDYENTYNEICESNNQFSFYAAEPVVGIDAPELNNSIINNYPNPFMDFTVFEFNSKNTKANKLEIVNLKGDIVFEYQFTASPSKQMYTWRGKNNHNQKLPTGIYWAYLKNEGSEIVSEKTKLVLQ